MPLLLGDVRDIGDGLLDSGVVEGSIKTSKSVHGRADKPADLLVERDVGPDKPGFAAGLPDQINRAIAAVVNNVSHDNLGALAGEGHGRRAANSGAAACYQCDFSRQQITHFLSPGLFRSVSLHHYFRLPADQSIP
jgi:hypothetical protein